MIVKEIKTNKLYDIIYSDVYDEYWILEGDVIIRVLSPNIFRDLCKEYIVEKD